MYILGLDPSNKDHNGFLIWDTLREIIVCKELLGGEDVVARLRDSRLPFTQYPIDVIMCETVQHMGMAVGKDVFETCFWIGEYRRVCKDLGITMDFVTRTTIKIHTCGTNRAKDPNITAAMIERYGYWDHGATGKGIKAHPGKLYGMAGDMWSALALAVYAMDQQAIEKRTGGNNA